LHHAGYNKTTNKYFFAKPSLLVHSQADLIFIPMVFFMSHIFFYLFSGCIGFATPVADARICVCVLAGPHGEGAGGDGAED
jgi:hypothetical protein